MCFLGRASPWLVVPLLAPARSCTPSQVCSRLGFIQRDGSKMPISARISSAFITEGSFGSTPTLFPVSKFPIFCPRLAAAGLPWRAAALSSSTGATSLPVLPYGETSLSLSSSWRGSPTAGRAPWPPGCPSGAAPAGAACAVHAGALQALCLPCCSIGPKRRSPSFPLCLAALLPLVRGAHASHLQGTGTGQQHLPSAPARHANWAAPSPLPQAAAPQGQQHAGGARQPGGRGAAHLGALILLCPGRQQLCPAAPGG